MNVNRTETVTTELGDFKISIIHDEDPQCPWELKSKHREDDAVMFVIWHRRYTLHEHDFERPEDAREWAEKNGWDVFPLYLYDHSGCAWSTTPFSCPWDSGQAGYVLVQREVWGDATDVVAVSQVKLLNDWDSGNTWGYQIDDPEGNEIDSCWGFVCDPDGYVLEEARSSLAGYVARTLAPAEQAAVLGYN